MQITNTSHGTEPNVTQFTGHAAMQQQQYPVVFVEFNLRKTCIVLPGSTNHCEPKVLKPFGLRDCAKAPIKTNNGPP